jgi:hypothetical protein
MKKASIVLGTFIYFTVVLGIYPALSFADTSITGKTDCAAGSSLVDPSGQQTFGMTDSAAQGIQSYVHNAESCASACLDENIAVKVGLLGVTIVVKATNQCKSTPITQPSKATPPRGCSSGQTQPQITLEVPEVSFKDTTYLKQQTIGPKSRCYGAVASTVTGLTKRGISGMSNPAVVQSNFDNLNALSSQAPLGAGAPVQTTIQGNEQLIQALTSSGVSVNDAQKIVSDPSSSQALINAYASGNKDTINSTVQDAATRAHISLNDGVYTNISSLSPQQVQASQSALSPLADQSGTTIPSSTFDTPNTAGTTAATPDISSTLAPLCNQLGGCGNVCPNSSIMVCNTNNPGALTWATWEAKYGGQPCGQSNNTACFPTMEQGIQAQARLLTTSNSYFASGTNTIWGEFCSSNYASGPGSNCAAYANFVSKQTGIPVNQTIDPNNAQQIGSILMAQSRMESGKGVIFTTDQLQSGLNLAYGTQVLPASTPGYTSATINTGVGGLGGIFGGGNTSGQVMLSSPFSNVSPIYSTPGLASASPYPIQYAQQASPTYPVTLPATQTIVPQNNSTTSGAGTITNIGKSGTAVAQIIAQQKSVLRGNPISISWSSVGMSPTTVCNVLEGSAMIARANEGVQTVISTTSGTISFSLLCTSGKSGAIITSFTQVLVQ